MSRITVYEVNVMFGDRDPAGLVFFPNFVKWKGASPLDFFMKRSEDVLCEGTETRAFCVPLPDNRNCIQIIAGPDEIKARCM